INRALKSAARAVVPVWRTTPLGALFRESGTPPAEVALAHARISMATRFKSLDHRHPLVLRTRPAPEPVRRGPRRRLPEKQT
ncbi:hypothetical protein QBC36DRAFT_147551, partial [Triangularia setosa]